VKTLLLIRHAKSSWNSDVGNDFDRPLNERGKRDAPEMATRLMRHGVGIDQFVSSPANRAKTTCILFARAFKRDEREILFIPELYHAHSDSFYQIIAGFDDAKSNIAVFSHNPGITDFVNSLTTTSVDNMPTCGIYAVTIKTLTWASFEKAEKECLFFDYPKSS
jgi:phosphohistidine phosphatase